jgi:5,10-methenyltetrahydrofolate synthetase
LPVTQLAAPLDFFEWTPTCAMHEDACGVPAPLNTPGLRPNLLLIPCLGYTQQSGQFYRLGYGGGYYDRTLTSPRATLAEGCLTLGVAYAETRCDASWVESHDQGLSGVVTQQGLRWSN